MAKILCVDFDGVLHSYTSGWQGADVVSDEMVPGAIRWLIDLLEQEEYEVHIYSSRSNENGGIDAMRDWLGRYIIDQTLMSRLHFPLDKPPAYLTIDDRAICFRGTFPSVLEMDNFKPWNK